MGKVEVKIEFERVVKYFVHTEISKSDFEKIKEFDMEDVPMYVRKNGKSGEIIDGNEIYDFLNDFAEEDNACDWGDELKNVTVTQVL